MKKLGKIKDLLSRNEMKQIQGGSGGCLDTGALCHSQAYQRCCNGNRCSGGWGIC